MKRNKAILLLLTGLVSTARAREVIPLTEGWRFFFPHPAILRGH